MVHPIDTTLALLQDAMTAHREALARGPSTPTPSELSLPQNRRAELVLRLLCGIEARAGIEVAQVPADRLLRNLAGVGLPELEDWVRRLEALPAHHPDWLSLIESMTVHETYVMRDPAQLQFFAAQLPALIDAARERTKSLRFWSVGCATGEEAYSIAALVYDALAARSDAVNTTAGMALTEPWRVDVLGSDISRTVLNDARAAIYDTGPLSSFRAESVVLLPHFPALQGGGARMAARHLRDAVRFAQFNLIEDTLPEAAFDAVFCRNVLIYFSARARRIAQETLRRAVRPGGYLVLGPTDTLIDVGDFEAMWGPDAVIYRRRSDDG
jgi:chemotaxis protein methyltransferase CheR